MKSLPFYLLEPGDRIVNGDLFMRIQTGNEPVPTLCHASWRGTLVCDCPEAIYLRRVRAPLPTPSRAENREASGCGVERPF
jgi:hypothetical protein